MGSEKVLENFSWGSWKVLDFSVSKRVGTLSLTVCRLVSVLYLPDVSDCLLTDSVLCMLSSHGEYDVEV